MQKVENETGKIEIWQDETADSPREWENLGTFLTWHSRYNSPDENMYSSYRDFLEEKANESSQHGLSEGYLSDATYDTLIKQIERQYVILPVYMYEHSGRSWSTAPFGCRWDSGQVGFIFVSKADIRKEYGCKLVSKYIYAKVVDRLNAEISVYETWAEGRVWGWTIYDRTGDMFDSCGGFYDDRDIAEAVEASLSEDDVVVFKELLEMLD